MFEPGMSALVLKICSEYAKALGLSFPPCVQQEINAIAQYVDLHTVKELKVEQDGSVVTITCFTEGEQEKVFTVTLPEVNVDTLSALLKGSSSVVVDKSEDGRTLVVRLDKSQEVQNIRLYNPQEPLTAEQLAILKANPENYIMLYGGSIYKLQSSYVRDENTWVYNNADLQINGTAGITNVVINMSNGVWSIESTNLQNDIIYIELSPSTATQGTLTSSQWDILEKDKSNCIVLNNEIYRLADNQNVSGLITYVHTGWDGTARKDKSISITVSTKAWTLVVAESGGGKMYLHVYSRHIIVEGDPKNTVSDIYFIFYSSSSTKLSGSEFKKIFDTYNTALVRCTIGGQYADYCVTQHAEVRYSEHIDDFVFMIPDIYNPANTNITLGVPGNTLYKELTPSITEV